MRTAPVGSEMPRLRPSLRTAAAVLGLLVLGTLVVLAFLTRRGAVPRPGPDTSAPVAVPTDVANPASQVDPVAATGHQLSGIVLDESQAPVRAFDIVVVPIAVIRFDAEQLPGKAFANEHGRFDLRAAEPGPWSLLVRSEGFAALWQSPVPGLAPLRLHLQRPPSIHGRTLDPDGQPIGGIGLEIFDARYPLIVDYRVDSTPDGRFQVTLNKPGGYVLRVGGEHKADFVPCLAGEAVQRDVHVPPATTVTCAIACAGKPLAGMAVTLRCGTADRIATTDAAGAATWTCVPRGHHALTVSIAGYVTQMHVIDTTREDETRFGRTVELTKQTP